MRHHARALATVAGSLLVAVAATSCSDGSSHSSSGSTPSASASAGTDQAEDVAHATSPTVTTKSTSLGKILVTSKGLTLYLFQKDKSSKSTCTGACAVAWPPLLVKGKPTAGGGAQSKLLSTTKRSKGALQVTYKGHPLYRFIGDRKPGTTSGQGLNNFGAKWYVVGTNGKAITTTPSRKPTSGGY